MSKSIKQIERGEKTAKELQDRNKSDSRAKNKINKTIGVCRYIYNFYLGHNKALHDKDEKFMTGRDFSVWLNNEYIPNNPEKAWIKEVSSKALKKSIEDGYTAFRKFFKHQSGFP